VFGGEITILRPGEKNEGSRRLVALPTRDHEDSDLGGCWGSEFFSYENLSNLWSDEIINDGPKIGKENKLRLLLS